MIDLSHVFLEKAEENLAAAESEFTNRRFNSCANRSYYACFQAAVYALARAGIRPPGKSGDWGHATVQAHFVGQLINRRKIYPSAIRNTLTENLLVRQVADYEPDHVTEARARRALRRAIDFIAVIREQRGQA